MKYQILVLNLRVAGTRKAPIVITSCGIREVTETKGYTIGDHVLVRYHEHDNQLPTATIITMDDLEQGDSEKLYGS